MNPGTHFTPAYAPGCVPALGGTHCPPWGDGVPSSENCCGRTCIHLTFLWIRSLEGKPGSGCRASETDSDVSSPPEGCCTGCPLRVRFMSRPRRTRMGGVRCEGNVCLQGFHWSLDEPLPQLRGPPHSDLCQDGHMKTVPGRLGHLSGFVRRTHHLGSWCSTFLQTHVLH